MDEGAPVVVDHGPVAGWTEVFAAQPDILSYYDFTGDQFHALVNVLERVDLKPQDLQSLQDSTARIDLIQRAVTQYAGTLRPEQKKELAQLALLSQNAAFRDQAISSRLGAEAQSHLGGAARAAERAKQFAQLLSGRPSAFEAVLLDSKNPEVFGLKPERRQPGSPAPSRGPRPMLDAIVVNSQKATVDETTQHVISHSYRDDSGNIKLGTDIIQLHVDFLDVYAGVKDIQDTKYLKQLVTPADLEYLESFKKMPDDQKHLIMKYYEIGDPRITAALTRVVAKGIKTTLIVDLNQSLTSSSGQSKDADFEKAAKEGNYKDSAPGAALKNLLDLGFEFGKTGKDAKLTILSGVPLFDPKDGGEKDLMHDKVTVAAGLDGKPFRLSLAGTANLNENEVRSPGDLPAFGGRFNSVYVDKDPDSINTDWVHAQAEIEAFKKREGFAKDISIPGNPDHRPIRILYPDGTYKETAFTDSIQNTNERIMKNIQEAIDSMKPGSKKRIIIKEIFFAQFVLTNTGEVELLRQLKKVQPWVKVWGLYDQEFISLDSFGEAGALAGQLVMRPWGAPIYPFPSEYADSMELYGYQRLVEGIGKIDMKEPQNYVHLMHRKLTGIDRIELDVPDGKDDEVNKLIEDARANWRVVDPKTHRYNFNPHALDNLVSYAGTKDLWTYVWERSFNNSLHYQNLESQTEFRFHGDSVVAKQIKDGVKLVVQSEPDWAIQLNVAIVRTFIARMTEHTVYDIDVKKYAAAMVNALTAKDYSQVSSILHEVAGLATKSLQPLNVKDVPARIEQFVGFLNWYADQAKDDKSLNAMTYQRAINIGWALLIPQNSYKLKAALDVLYYHPNRTPEKRLELMKKAWKEGLHMKTPFPDRPRDTPKAVAPVAAPGV